MSEVLGIIREFGFPTLFCLWLMWRMEKRLDAFIEGQSRVLIALTVMAKALDLDIERDTEED